MSNDNKAGRPPIYNKRMTRINVMVDDWTLEHWREIGDGNVSAGARQSALESAAHRRLIRDEGKENDEASN